MDNKLEKLFDRLREEGWYCGWAETCCQSCAWDCLPFEHEIGPFKGKDVDFSKCLFNHEQDCENEYGLSDDTMTTFSSSDVSDSLFCFDGQKEGVKNLKAILPIIEEMGCTYHWNKKGNSRISIDWSEKDERH